MKKQKETNYEIPNFETTYFIYSHSLAHAFTSYSISVDGESAQVQLWYIFLRAPIVCSRKSD